jgi:dihydroorotase
MTHHALSSVDLSGCPGRLAKGDIYTHTYHGWASTITPVAGGTVGSGRLAVHEACLAARRGGVIFDVGHGAGAFNWRVAEMACGENFFPDVISTDLHMENCHGPVYDLATVMTKFLHLGMPLGDVICATTWAAAKAIRWEDRIGSLSPGLCADITVIGVEEVDVMLEDCHRQKRNVRQRIVPRAVWRAGVRFPIALPEVWPNPHSGREQHLRDLEVRDENWEEILHTYSSSCCS